MINFIKKLFSHNCKHWGYRYSDMHHNGLLVEIEYRCGWCHKIRKVGPGLSYDNNSYFMKEN
jgi:hypothetical protein